MPSYDSTLVLIECLTQTNTSMEQSLANM
jgi:hypothetical protein